MWQPRFLIQSRGLLEICPVPSHIAKFARHNPQSVQDEAFTTPVVNLWEDAQRTLLVGLRSPVRFEIAGYESQVVKTDGLSPVSPRFDDRVARSVKCTFPWLESVGATYFQAHRA